MSDHHTAPHPGDRRLSRTVSLLAFLSLAAGAVVAAPAAVAAEPPKVEGATVTADDSSPTGYTVEFVYHNPDATQVRLAGDLTLLDLGTGTTRYQPEAWQTGRYHAGGTEFLRDMTKDSKGYWSVSVPLHAGSLSYWYRVWDPTRGWANKRIWDPASTNPRPPGESSFRVRNNDVLDAVYVPYTDKQNDPVLKERAEYELPIADPSQRGTVQYIPTRPSSATTATTSVSTCRPATTPTARNRTRWCTWPTASSVTRPTS
jgi:hypothetical protein